MVSTSFGSVVGYDVGQDHRFSCDNNLSPVVWDVIQSEPNTCSFRMLYFDLYVEFSIPDEGNTLGSPSVVNVELVAY